MDTRVNNIESVLQKAPIITEKPKLEKMTKVATGPKSYFILLIASLLLGLLLISNKKYFKK